MPNDKLEAVHRYLKSHPKVKGFTIAFVDFEEDMKNEDNLRAVYRKLGELNPEFKREEADFFQDMGYQASKKKGEAIPTTTTAEVQPQPGGAVAQPGAETLSDGGIAQSRVVTPEGAAVQETVVSPTGQAAQATEVVEQPQATPRLVTGMGDTVAQQRELLQQEAPTTEAPAEEADDRSLYERGWEWFQEKRRERAGVKQQQRDRELEARQQHVQNKIANNLRLLPDEKEIAESTVENGLKNMPKPKEFYGDMTWSVDRGASQADYYTKLAHEFRNLTSTQQAELIRKLAERGDFNEFIKEDPNWHEKLGEMIGSQMPAIVLSAMTGALAPITAGGIQGAQALTQSFTNYYQRAKEMGLSDEEATKKAAMLGSISQEHAWVEGAIGTLNPFGKAGGKVLGKAIFNSLDVGVDAGAAAAMQMIENDLAKAEDMPNELWDEVAENAGGEAIFSVLMKLTGVPGGIYNRVKKKAFASNPNLTDEQKAQIDAVERGDEAPPQEVIEEPITEQADAEIARQQIEAEQRREGAVKGTTLEPQEIPGDINERWQAELREVSPTIDGAYRGIESETESGIEYGEERLADPEQFLRDRIESYEFLLKEDRGIEPQETLDEYQTMINKYKQELAAIEKVNAKYEQELENLKQQADAEGITQQTTEVSPEAGVEGQEVGGVRVRDDEQDRGPEEQRGEAVVQEEAVEEPVVGETPTTTVTPETVAPTEEVTPEVTEEPVAAQQETAIATKIPIESTDALPGPVTDAINEKVKELTDAGDTEATQTVNKAVADSIKNEVNNFAKENNLDLEVSDVVTGEGTYTDPEGNTKTTPNFILTVKGDPDNIQMLMERSAQALGQRAGNSFTKVSNNDKRTRKDLDEVFVFRINEENFAPLWDELQQIKDSNGNNLFGGKTKLGEDYVVHSKFSDIDYNQEIENNRDRIEEIFDKYDDGKWGTDKQIVKTYEQDKTDAGRKLPEDVADQQLDKAKQQIGDNLGARLNESFLNTVRGIKPAVAQEVKPKKPTTQKTPKAQEKKAPEKKRPPPEKEKPKEEKPTPKKEEPSDQSKAEERSRLARLPKKEETDTHKYLLTQRPPSIGTHPIKGLRPDPKEVTYQGRRKAWLLEYDRPLTDKEVADFELSPQPSENERGDVYKRKFGNLGNMYMVVTKINDGTVDIVEYANGKERESTISFREFAKRKGSDEWTRHGEKAKKKPAPKKEQPKKEPPKKEKPKAEEKKPAPKKKEEKPPVKKEEPKPTQAEKDLREAEADIEGIEAEIEGKQEEIQSLRSDLKNINNDEDVIKIKKQIADLREKKKKTKGYEAKENIQEEIEGLKEEINEIKEDIRDQIEDIKDREIGDLKDDLKEAKKEVRRAQKKIEKEKAKVAKPKKVVTKEEEVPAAKTVRAKKEAPKKKKPPEPEEPEGPQGYQPKGESQQAASPIIGFAERKAKADVKGGDRIAPKGIERVDKEGRRIKPKKLNEIINDLYKNLNRFKKVIGTIKMAKTPIPGRKGIAASFDPLRRMIALRRFNNLDDLAHELSHGMDKTFDLYKGIPDEQYSEIVEELTPFVAYGSPAPVGVDQHRYEMREGIAEWLRAYIVNPEEAKENAPKFYKHYRKQLSNEAHDLVHAYSDDLRLLMGTTYHEVIDASIANRPKTMTDNIRATWHELLENLHPHTRNPNDFKLTYGDRMAQKWFDALRPFEASVKFAALRGEADIEKLLPKDNPLIMARLFSGVNERVENQIERGLMEGESLKRVRDEATGDFINLSWLLEPLNNETTESLNEELREVMTYGVAKRTTEMPLKFIERQIHESLENGEIIPADVINYHERFVRKFKERNDRARELAYEKNKQWKEKIRDKAAERKDKVADKIEERGKKLEEAKEKKLDKVRAKLQQLKNDREKIGNKKYETEKKKLDVHKGTINQVFKKDVTRLLREQRRENARIEKAADNAMKKVDKSIKFANIQKPSAVKAWTGIGGGLENQLEVAERRIEEVERQYGEQKRKRIQEALRRYQVWSDTLLKNMVASGRISKESYRAIKDTNEEYIALNRLMDEEIGGDVEFTVHKSGKGLATVAEPLKKLEGSTRMIKDPYQSLIENTYRSIKETDRNNVLRTFVDFMENMARQDTEQAGRISKIISPASRKDKNTVSIWRDGKEEIYKLDQDLFNSLKGITETIEEKGNIFTKMAAGMRASVTLNPVFAARNMVRDLQTMMVLSENVKTIQDVLPRKKEDIGDVTQADAFSILGGGQGGYHLLSPDFYYKSLDENIRKLSQEKGNIVMQGHEFARLAGKTMQSLSERSEKVTRMKEFRNAFARYKKMGYDDYNAGLQAAYDARSLMDFAIAGEYAKVFNKYVPFTNAKIQGLRIAYKKAKKNPGLFAAKAFMSVMLPQMLLRMMYSDEDEERYRQLPAYQRNQFWNIPLSEGWLTIPKPHDIAIFSSLTDLGYDMAMGYDVQDGYGEMLGMLQQMLPISRTDFAGPLRSLTEAAANFDFFRQRNIVSPYETSRALEKRNYEQASNLGKFIGENTNIDPRKIDHIIRGQFTYFGQQGMALSDIGREDKPTDLRKLSGFYKAESPAIYRDVQWLQEQAGLYGLEKEPYYDFLKEMVYAYYNAENKEVKKNLAKEIRNFSGDIKRVWKAHGIKDKKAIENEIGFQVESVKDLVPEMKNAIDNTKDPVVKRTLENALKGLEKTKEKVKVFKEKQ